jgi:hypothetical protein
LVLSRMLSERDRDSVSLAAAGAAAGIWLKIGSGGIWSETAADSFSAFLT